HPGRADAGSRYARRVLVLRGGVHAVVLAAVRRAGTPGRGARAAGRAASRRRGLTMLRWFRLLIRAAVLAVPAVVEALQPPSGFVRVDQPPQTESLPAAPLIVAAYAFVWVALILYLLSIWRRLGRVESEMDALERRLGERTGARS